MGFSINIPICAGKQKLVLFGNLPIKLFMDALKIFKILFRNSCCMNGNLKEENLVNRVDEIRHPIEVTLKFPSLGLKYVI